MRGPWITANTVDVDVSRSVDSKGDYLVVVNVKMTAGRADVELRLPLDVTEALQYALEQVLR